MTRMFAILGADRCSDLPKLLLELSSSVDEGLGAVHGLAYWQVKQEYAFRRMPSESRRRLALTAVTPSVVMMGHSRESLPMEDLIPFGTQPFPCRGGALMHQGAVTVPDNWPETQADSQRLVAWIQKEKFAAAVSRLDNPHAVIFSRADHTMLAVADELPLFVLEFESGVHVLHDFALNLGGDDLRGHGVTTFQL